MIDASSGCLSAAGKKICVTNADWDCADARPTSTPANANRVSGAMVVSYIDELMIQ